MTNKQTWGRKETIVWPPHAPIYTLSALALGFLVTLLFVWQHLRFSETPLQQTYTTTYVESLVRCDVQAAVERTGCCMSAAARLLPGWHCRPTSFPAKQSCRAGSRFRS